MAAVAATFPWLIGPSPGCPAGRGPRVLGLLIAFGARGVGPVRAKVLLHLHLPLLHFTPQQPGRGPQVPGGVPPVVALSL